MRFVRIALLLTAAMVLTGCQAAKNKPSDDTIVVEYSDWRYQNFPAQKGEGVIHAAVTAAKPQGSKVVTKFFSSASSANCARIFQTIIIESEKPFPKDILVKDLKGELRIDDLSPHPVTYQYDAKSGSTNMFLDFFALFDNETIRKEVQNGQMIRFSVEVDKEKRTFKFTLRNINNAMATLVDNCKESSSFQGAVKGKPAQNQPSGKAPQGAPGKAGNDDDKQFFK